MTYQTKKHFREEVERLKMKLSLAESTLSRAGYSYESDLWSIFGRHQWVLSDAKIDAELAEKHKREAVIHKAALKNGAGEALKLVINALELREYKESTPIYKHGEMVRTSVVIDTDRLKADLETAIRVREEKAKATAERATEERITGLADVIRKASR